MAGSIQSARTRRAASKRFGEVAGSIGERSASGVPLALLERPLLDQKSQTWLHGLFYGGSPTQWGRPPAMPNLAGGAQP